MSGSIVVAGGAAIRGPGQLSSNNEPAAQSLSAGATRFCPPLTEELWPLDVLRCPPLIEE